jgi:hypothetical protein
MGEPAKLMERESSGSPIAELLGDSKGPAAVLLGIFVTRHVTSHPQHVPYLQRLV